MHAGSLAVRAISGLCALSLGLLLASCGGGGGGGNSTPAPTYTIGVTVSGLVGTAPVLVLQNNGGNNLTVSTNGAFTFSAPMASGAAYKVTVFAKPTNPSQGCTVSGGSGNDGSGIVGNANVINIAVACVTNASTIGGTVFVTGGGPLGAGLELQNNSGDNLVISAKGTFIFSTPVAIDSPGSPSTYDVTVLNQPTNPTQTCTVTHGSGTVPVNDVSDVTVTCTTNTYAITGTVSGFLAGTPLVLRNGTDSLTILANGSSPRSFSFPPVASGEAYAVSVFTQPTGPAQTCTVVNGTGAGTVVDHDITNVAIVCQVNTYKIGGTVSVLGGGPLGANLALQNNLGDDKLISAVGPFQFNTSIASGQAYSVSVLTQPNGPTQNCVVSNGTGTVVDAVIDNVNIVCTTNKYTIKAAVSGLSGTVVLQDNGTDDKTITANGTFSFGTTISSGSAYAVTVLTQPSTPISQTCAASPVGSGSGTVGGADVTVNIVCTTNKYTIKAAVSGLSGTVVLQDNGTDDKTITANGTFSFGTTISSGSAYAVTVLTQPSTPISQTCAASPVGSGSGTVGGADVTVNIVCTTNSYTIGGTVTGLTGTNMVLQNNLGDNKTISANGTFNFGTKIASGALYSVTVLTQPSVPEQACTVLNGAGTVVSADVNVSVVCATPSPRFAYVPNFFDNTVSIYAVNAATGQLRHRGSVAAGTGPVAVSIDPSGKFVYVANETSGTVSAYSINAATGALTSAGAVSSGTNPQSVAVDPTGKFAYVANAGLPLNTGFVSAYSINATTGALTPVAGSPFAAGTNPTSLSIDPSGRVYVANAGDGATPGTSSISVYSINAVTGALTPIVAPVTAGLKPTWITVDPSGKFVYATNFNSATVSAYKTDAAAGLIPVGDAATGIGPRSVAVDPSGKFAYVVNQNGGATGSIRAYNIDALTGALSPTGAADPDTGNLPVGIAIDPFSKLAYVANVGSDEISAYSIDAAGALTALPKIVGGTANQAMAMTKGAPLIYTPKFAYVANSGSNNVSAYTIDAGTPPTPGTGALTPVAGSPFAAGTTPKSVGVDPFGRFAYVANGGGNVSAYTINPSTGALTHVGTDIAAGTSPASVSVGPSGRFAYVANAGDGINPSTVSAYSIDAGTGSLTHVGTDAATGISPASVTVHPTGRFAYVANSGSNDVSAYSINPSSGVLTQIDSDSVAVGIQNFAAGTSPKSVSVDPTGRFAYVANGDGTVSSFRIDPPSGALILPGSVSAGTNPASVAVEPSGKFAYVARGDGNVSVHAIDAVPGGSGALASASSTTAAGTSPVSVTVDASGQFAYVANSGSANVSAYKVNSGGSLSAVSGSPFGAGSAPSSVTTTGTIQ